MPNADAIKAQFVCEDCRNAFPVDERRVFTPPDTADAVPIKRKDQATVHQGTRTLCNECYERRQRS